MSVKTGLLTYITSVKTGLLTYITSPTYSSCSCPNFATTLSCDYLVLPHLSLFHCDTFTVVPQCHKNGEKGISKQLCLSSFCRILWTLSCRPFLQEVPYSGKLSREKTHKFCGVVAICESFLREIWDVAFFGAAKASNPRRFSWRKSDFSPICESFLPQKFPAIRYHVLHLLLTPKLSLSCGYFV